MFVDVLYLPDPIRNRGIPQKAEMNGSALAEIESSAK